MAVKCIEEVVYGVEDLAAARRFWTDFGLTEAPADGGGMAFAAGNGGRITVRPLDDPSLPATVHPGSTVREVVWGVEAESDLDKFANALSAVTEVSRGDDGSVRFRDPAGDAMALRVTKLADVGPPDSIRYNTPGAPGRVDARGVLFDHATPRYVSHVVFMTPKIEETQSFYVDLLGFKVTDYYKGEGYFLRCGASHEHHNLFLLSVGDQSGFHHLAFEVSNVHELFGGGLAMGQKGWQTHLGPGRHPISSCYFWYFKNPCGGAAEYDFDSDYVTDAWVPGRWDRTPEVFAEWALQDGIQLYGGVQTGKV